MKQGRRKGSTYLILDRQLLEDELRRAIHQQTAGQPRPAGSLRAAQELSGVSIATLSRLLSRKTEFISRTILDGILKLVPPKRYAILQAAFLTPEAQELLDAAESAAQAEWMALRRSRTGMRWVGDASGLRAVPDSRNQSRDGQHARETEFDVLAHLVENLCYDLFNAFDREFPPDQFGEWRTRLAKGRTIAPLLTYREAGLIERSWRELEGRDGKWNELRAFVKAGLDRERILLRRKPDSQRAMEITQKEPSQYTDLRMHEWIAVSKKYVPKVRRQAFGFASQWSI